MRLSTLWWHLHLPNNGPVIIVIISTIIIIAPVDMIDFFQLRQLHYTAKSSRS